MKNCVHKTELRLSKVTNQQHGRVKSTWRRAGTGLAEFQTACHVLPGMSMRELNRPFRIWFVSSVELLESVRNKTQWVCLCLKRFIALSCCVHLFRLCLPSTVFASSIQSRGLYQRIKSSSFPFGLAALKLSISDNSDALIICVRSSGGFCAVWEEYQQKEF